MPVFLDIESRLDARLAEQAAAQAVTLFRRAGDDINKGLSGAISKALGSFDSSTARREIQSLTAEFGRLQDAEKEAARIMSRSAADVETALRRSKEATDKHKASSSQAAKAQGQLADAQARAARDSRAYVDAMVASEQAHSRLGTATDKTADATSAASRVWNGVGITSVAAFGTALVGTTKAAGDFQQSMMKLQAAAGMPADQMKTASDGILKMAGQVGYSSQDLAAAMFTIRKAGYDASEGLTVLQAAAQGANAEQAPLGDVVQALTTSLQDFHVPADQAAKVMSQMVTAVGQSKVPLNDFAGALHTIEPAAAAAHLSLADVWGVLAQITQSGTSADQAAVQIQQAMRSLSGAQGPARDAMQQLGINADDVSQKLSTRGLAGTMQYLSDTVMAHFADANQVNVGELRNAAQAQANANQMLDQMSPSAQAAAKALENGTEGHREYQLAVRGANEEDAQRMKQFQTLIDQVDGFSSRFAKGRETLETYNQAMNDVTGTQEGAQIAFQTTGEHAAETNKRIGEISDTTTDADGKVKGFTESQDTLNAKMRDAKAAFGAAAIEVGSAFVPVMTDVANVAKTVGDEMAKHPRIVHDVIDALGILGTAWLAFKAINVAQTILTPIATSLGSIVAGEEGAATATGALGTAMAGLGRAVPLVAGAAIAANSQSNAMKQAGEETPEEIGQKQGNWAEIKALFHQTFWASGGQVSGPGPKGQDSVAAWLAPGEHVLTAGDVDAMGGHGNVYAFRNALHRADGGAIDGSAIDAAILSRVPAGIYTQTQGADLTKGLADCSSAVEDLVNIMDGRSTAGRQMSTGNEAQWLTAHGFMPGMGGPGDFRVGFNSEHTQATLPGGTPFNWGSDAAAARRGIGGTGAYDPAFTSHFYRPVSDDPEKLSRAQEAVEKADAKVTHLEEQISELKANTKQAERDKLQDDLKFAKEDAQRARDELEKAKQGSARPTSGGSRSGSGKGGLQFGAPLPDDFGLKKGIPGFFEWLTTFAADMAIGPIEGKMYGDALRAGQINPDGSAADGSDTSGGYADLGDQGTAIPSIAAADYGPSGGGSPFLPPASGGSGGGAPSGGSGSGWRAPSGGGIPGLSLATGATPRGGAPGAVPGMGLALGALTNRGAGPAPVPGAPSRMLFGPPSPEQGLGVGTLERLHGMDTPGAFHVAPPGPAPTTTDIPQLPGGGVDFGKLRDRFSGSVPLFPQAPPTSNYTKQWYSPYLNAPGYATGGPTGTDTIPAWLSPGEFVMNQQATHNNLGALQWMNAGHYDTGTTQPIQPGQPPKPAAPAPPKPGAQQPKKPDAKPKPQPHIGPGGPSSPGPGNLNIPGGSDTHPGLTTPGGSTEQFGQELPASGGIGFGGGLIGAAEGAAAGAAGAAGAMGGGAGAAAGAGMGAAFQALNRTAGYIGQLGGIAAEGILSTFLPADSPLSNFSNTLPGKLIAGIAGVRPGQPNSAGKTEAPLKPKEGEEKGGGETHHVGTQFNGPITVKADNPDKFHSEMSRQYSAAQAAYPSNVP